MLGTRAGWTHYRSASTTFTYAVRAISLPGAEAVPGVLQLNCLCFQRLSVVPGMAGPDQLPLFQTAPRS